jgi:hypothetical protein
MASWLFPADSGRFEHDLLQAIAIGDEDHKVEFAILHHQTSGESASLYSFLGDAYGVRQLLLNWLQGNDVAQILSVELPQRARNFLYSNASGSLPSALDNWADRISQS